MSNRIASRIKRILKMDPSHEIRRNYTKRFNKYAFTDGKCRDERQYEASITRLYHTLEKGLAYEADFIPGRGIENARKLLTAMEQYAAGYDTTAFFYETALSTLHAFVEKNAAFGFRDAPIEKRLAALPGKPNAFGGTVLTERPPEGQDFKAMLESRHSIRHFAKSDVCTEKIDAALALAQYTPSACNRQGWGVTVITDREKIAKVLAYQNGNRGFGQELGGLLLVTAELKCFQKGREQYQPYVDGGMYAQNILNALCYYGIGSVPLSAALTADQEKSVRELTGIGDSEVPVLFIGIGNYPEEKVQTTRSARHAPRIRRIDG